MLNDHCKLRVREAFSKFKEHTIGFARTSYFPNIASLASEVEFDLEEKNIFQDKDHTFVE
ncbi:MAG: hypothetical protein IPK55_11135 [Streptococcus sp.]|jgi:hypothetical protein|nr:hypothetical protein [Streptococcus sp.]